MSVSIHGKVSDETGKPLSGVKVLARHEPTGSVFAKSSDADGSYEFLNVRAGGPYTLSTTMDGYAPVEARGLKLNSNESREHNFSMTPA